MPDQKQHEALQMPQIAHDASQAVVTRAYGDGTVATGVPPLPEYSPRVQQALLALDAVESMLGGSNGPTIQIRAVLTTPPTALSAFIADVEAAQGAGGWQPIETAPKDGTSILGYWLGGQHDCAIHATKFHKGRWWAPNEDYPHSPPTHWRPLPLPPSPSQAAPAPGAGVVEGGA